MNFFLFIGYGCLVCFVSLMSLQSISDFSIAHLDKLFHLITYTIFTVLGYRVANSKSGFLYICIGIVIFSGLIEILQSLMPDRMMSAADLVANIMGVLLACFFIRQLTERRKAVW